MVKRYLLVLLFVHASSASANFISLQVGDWRIPGDAMVVRDVDNGLE